MTTTGKWLSRPRSRRAVMPLKGSAFRAVVSRGTSRLDHRMRSGRKPDFISAEHTGATPAININGWLDVGAYETVKLFEFQQHHPDQYLIMAPTGHCKMIAEAGAQAYLGDRPMGDTRFPYDDVIMSWIDRLLKGEETAWKEMPKVQVFLMGAGTWLTGDAWPLPETQPVTKYLNSAKSANTLWGDGVLQDTPAESGASSDHYLCDPHNSVPTFVCGL